MKYSIDTEFIDTPTCSALLSFAIVSESGVHRYFEFDYPADEVTPWLKEHVVPQLGVTHVSFQEAAESIRRFVRPSPTFYAYYGAYDWYWFCRLFGGFLEMPQDWPHVFTDFAHFVDEVPNIVGDEHHALNDARSLMRVVLEPRNLQVAR
jgi:3' exoribonuclease, RNase T-like